MSIGIRLHDVAGDALLDKVRSAKAQGFQCAHLALSKVISPALMEPAAATPGLAADLRAQMDGMEIALLGCYLNLAHPDPVAYRAIAKKYQAHLRLCRWLQADLVGTETGNPNAEYRFDPATSHTEEALRLFIDRLAPVVEDAEKLGVLIAIEPVFSHIVSTPARARAVLDAVRSPNLRIIFDPVNLLDPEHLDQRDRVLAQAMELLGEEIALVHLKDYRVENHKLMAVAPGLGEMDYTAVFRFLAASKPGIHITLENTRPENAQAAREFVQNGLG